jgi:hypothetical protein
MYTWLSHILFYYIHCLFSNDKTSTITNKLARITCWIQKNEVIVEDRNPFLKANSSKEKMLTGDQLRGNKKCHVISRKTQFHTKRGKFHLQCKCRFLDKMIIDRRLFLHIRSNFIETIKTEKNHNRKETHRDALLVNLSLDKKKSSEPSDLAKLFQLRPNTKKRKKEPVENFSPVRPLCCLLK